MSQNYSKELSILQMKVLEIQNKLQAFPKEELLCAKNGKYYKWYITNGKHPVYLSKKNRKLAEKLALKKYYTYQYQEVLAQIEHLNKLTKFSDPNNSLSLMMLDENSPYSELLIPIFQKFSDTIQEWLNENYDRVIRFPEKLIHKTLSGYMVRSKSEAIISNSLFTNKIPHRYECKLTLGNTILHPDFTILHPTTHKLSLWEHFGMMDDISYLNKACDKLKLYGHHGYIPSINLITTYETKEHPLNSAYVSEIIQQFYSNF